MGHSLRMASPRAEGIKQRKGARSRWRRRLTAMGPGLVTGASDDDPSGIATYAQAGAQYHFGLLWLALISFPLMFAVQEICDRTALSTGRNLGEIVVDRFDRTWRVILGAMLVLLIGANAFNIAADLVAVGAGMHLLHGGPPALWAAVAGLSISLLVVLGSFEVVARVCKFLCLALLAYVAVLFFLHIGWPDVIAGLLVPHVQATRAYVALVVAVLGTTISPYLFFWQSEHRVEQLREDPIGGKRAVPITRRLAAQAREKQRESRLDVFSGMALSQVVMFAIIVTTAVALHRSGVTVTSAAQAASALRPVAGSASATLFALGFVGAGFLAVPVLAGSASGALAGMLRQQWGYSRQPRHAAVFYGLVALGTVGGTALTTLSVNPIALLVVAALVNGLAAAPFLVLVMVISRDRDIMGPYANGRWANAFGWLTVAIMTVSALLLVVTGAT